MRRRTGKRQSVHAAERTSENDSVFEKIRLYRHRIGSEFPVVQTSECQKTVYGYAFERHRPPPFRKLPRDGRKMAPDRNEKQCGEWTNCEESLPPRSDYVRALITHVA